jgi:GT2 family glycosyltransferase
MKVSHIICSRNRAAQLRVTLSKLDCKSLARNNVQLVLVDNASDDETLAIMEDYAKQSPVAICVSHTDRIGHSIALNVGVAASNGELIIFTDDDCYLEYNYYDALLREFDPTKHQYGTGQILLFDPSDDKRLGINAFSQKLTIPPRSVLPTGMVQGANMFFLRQVFERAGNFSEDLGPGTAFNCADIELAARASFAGFVGVMLPEVIVYHHHQRKPGSAESDTTLRGYTAGRGAYYAIGMTRGINEFWQLWARLFVSKGQMPDARAMQLELEFRGAADYLKHYLEKKQMLRG